MEDVIFWKLDGYKKVLEDIRQGQRSCESFMKMVQERADIEERYSRSLEGWRERWIQSVKNGRECTGTVEAWCLCLEEATDVAQVHRACLDRLTGSTGPIVNMMGWIDENYKRSDDNGFHLVQRLEEEFQAASEEFTNEYTRAMRAKEAYHTLSKEAQKARKFAEIEQHETKVNDTTKTRLFSRADKLTIRENYVRRIYKRRVAGCVGEVKDRYKEQMEAVLEKCREVESARLQCLQNQLLTFITLLDMTSSSESLLKNCRSRYGKVTSKDTSLDVQEWLLHFHLSRFIQLPTFEEYYLEEENYKPLEKIKTSTDKTRRPSGSFFQFSLFGSSSEDEVSRSSKSSSSSSSSESESSSSSSESESETSSPTSVSTLPRSSSKHTYDTIANQENQSNFPLEDSVRQQSVFINANFPHSTSSTGFPVNYDNPSSSTNYKEYYHTPLIEENTVPNEHSDRPTFQHQIHDTPKIKSPPIGNVDNTTYKSYSEGNKADMDYAHYGKWKSEDLFDLGSNVKNVTEIHTSGPDNIASSEGSEKNKQASTSSQTVSPSPPFTGSQDGHTNHSTLRNLESSNVKQNADGTSSEDLTYIPGREDGAVEARSFVGPYFVSKNFRWASVSPPVPVKPKNRHSSENCAEEMYDNEVFTVAPSTKYDDRTDFIELKTHNNGSEVRKVDSDHAGYPGEDKANSDVCVEDDRNCHQPQMSHECQMTQMRSQFPDRPIKACLAQWFLGKYPEYAQYGEGMWGYLQDANPCRYRAAMMDAKRLMLAVSVRSMIRSSSDKPRALHLCNSLHRCRECVNEEGPCKCHYHGERPPFGQHSSNERFESESVADDVCHVMMNDEVQNIQDHECDHVFQKATNRILHLHGQLRRTNDCQGKDCGNVHDHSKESVNLCNVAAGLILGHECNAEVGESRYKSLMGGTSTSGQKSFRSAVQNVGSGYPERSSGTQGSNIWEDNVTSQESDFSSDESISATSFPSCDQVRNTQDNMPEEAPIRISNERDSIERQACQILRPSEGEFLVKVLYNFRPANWDELRLRAGEYIVQVGQASDNGWATGRNRTKHGIFPASYVQFVKSRPARKKEETDH